MTGSAYMSSRPASAGELDTFHRILRAVPLAADVRWADLTGGPAPR